MHHIKNIIAHASMIGRYFADKGEPDKVRKQFALVRSVADLETNDRMTPEQEMTPDQELCYAAIDAQEETLVYMANQNVIVEACDKPD